MTSAFKQLFTDAIRNNGDASKYDTSLHKLTLSVFVKETSPYFLVSDGFFYVPAYFTKAALDDFNKRYPNVKHSDLQGKVVLINQWSVELKRVDSNAVFTSYGGVEVRLIVSAFKPQFDKKNDLHPSRHPTNLYRDDEFKTAIQQLRHNSVQRAVANLAVPDVPLFSKGDVSQGIVSTKGDDWHFREGNTAVVTLGTARRADAGASGAARVKMGKRAAKAATKAAPAKKAAGRAAPAVLDKVNRFTHNKKQGGKKSAVAAKGSATGGKKSAVNTTDEMTMHNFKKYLAHQKKANAKTISKRK